MFSDLETQHGKDPKLRKGEGFLNLRVKFFPEKESAPTYTLFWTPRGQREKQTQMCLPGWCRKQGDTLNPELDTRASRCSTWSSTAGTLEVTGTLEVSNAAWVKCKWPGIWGGAQLSLPESRSLGKLLKANNYWRQKKRKKVTAKMKDSLGYFAIFP